MAECSIGSSSAEKSGLLALSQHSVFRMALTPDSSLTMRPRVRVWCARTGEFLYEPSHPRLDEIRLHVLKNGLGSMVASICQKHIPCFTYTSWLHNSLLMTFSVWGSSCWGDRWTSCVLSKRRKSQILDTGNHWKKPLVTINANGFGFC